MAILVDPDQALPGAKKHPVPSQVISWLLYPVIFVVGVTVGIAIGIKEAPSFENQNTNTRVYSNAKIVTNVNSSTNTSVNKNTNVATNKNTNTSTNTSILNTNIFTSGDAGKIDATTQAQLQTIKQANLLTLVDKSLTMSDVIRQQDLIDLQYALNSYYVIRQEYPSTDGQQIKLNRTSDDLFYTAMKEFYGGTYYEKIDPDFPNYYYGYVSDGQTYSLSAYLTSTKKAFVVTSESE